VPAIHETIFRTAKKGENVVAIGILAKLIQYLKKYTIDIK